MMDADGVSATATENPMALRLLKGDIQSEPGGPQERRNRVGWMVCSPSLQRLAPGS